MTAYTHSELKKIFQTLDQLFTVTGFLEGSWEFVPPVYMGFVDMEKVFNHVPRGTLRVCVRGGGLQVNGIVSLLLQAIQSLYKQCSCMRVWFSLTVSCHEVCQKVISHRGSAPNMLSCFPWEVSLFLLF